MKYGTVVSTVQAAAYPATVGVKVLLVPSVSSALVSPYSLRLERTLVHLLHRLGVEETVAGGRVVAGGDAHAGIGREDLRQ